VTIKDACPAKWKEPEDAPASPVAKASSPEHTEARP